MIAVSPSFTCDRDVSRIVAPARHADATGADGTDRSTVEAGALDHPGGRTRITRRSITTADESVTGGAVQASAESSPLQPRIRAASPSQAAHRSGGNEHA